MNTTIYRQAAENVAGEPVTIESDGTVWADSDHRIIDSDDVVIEYDRLVAQNEASRASAIAHAKSLGFTDEMIAVMYPNLQMGA